MKTITEFSGFYLRPALDAKNELFNAKKSGKAPAAAAAPAEEAPAPEAAPAEETPAEQPAETAPATDAPAETPAPEGTKDGKGKKPQRPRIEVTREELSPVLAEKLKVEGDKLELLLSVVELVDFRRIGELRRVVVYQLAEGEKAPVGAAQKDDKVFVTEYLPSLQNAGRPRKGGRDDDRGRGKRRGGKGGRGDRDGGGGRGPGGGGRGPGGGERGAGGRGGGGGGRGPRPQNSGGPSRS